MTIKEKSIKPEPTFLENPVLDNLVDVTLALGAELWVQRERMRIVEALLAQHGRVTPELIEAYQEPPEQQALLRQQRDEFVARIFGAYSRDTTSTSGPSLR